MRNLLLKKNNVVACLIKLRWPLGCLLYFITLSSCSIEGRSPEIRSYTPDPAKEKLRISRAWEKIGSIKRFIKTGDLVTRTGNDFTSESLRSLNQRNKTYSHCGIASIENDSLFVYHALGGEFNPDQKIRRDRWEEFAEPFSNRGVGVFRFKILPPQVEATILTIRKYILADVTFDMDFDLATNEKMYCAEFVAKTYEKGSPEILVFPRSRIRAFEFIGVDDIFLHPACDSITSTVYK